jgi:hypothetical protein
MSLRIRNMFFYGRTPYNGLEPTIQRPAQCQNPQWQNNQDCLAQQAGRHVSRLHQAHIHLEGTQHGTTTNTVCSAAEPHTSPSAAITSPSQAHALVAMSTFQLGSTPWVPYCAIRCDVEKCDKLRSGPFHMTAARQINQPLSWEWRISQKSRRRPSVSEAFPALYHITGLSDRRL